MLIDGIIRRVDDLGRIIIPKKIRNRIGLQEGEPMQISLNRRGEVILSRFCPIPDLMSELSQIEAAYDIDISIIGIRKMFYGKSEGVVCEPDGHLIPSIRYFDYIIELRNLENLIGWIAVRGRNISISRLELLKETILKTNFLAD